MPLSSTMLMNVPSILRGYGDAAIAALAWNGKMRLSPHLRRPSEISSQIGAILPAEVDKLARCNRSAVDSRPGFNAPFAIRTGPGPQSRNSRCGYAQPDFPVPLQSL